MGGTREAEKRCSGSPFVFLFHILRNLSGAYYLVLAGFCGLFFLLFINNWRDIKYSALGIFVIFFWTYASLVSVLWFDLYGDYSIGIFRLWASLPLLFVAMVLARDNLKVPMQLISFFFSLAALSFLWQYVFGPIEWFAEASERAGGARFASLVGSLTAYGVMVGVPALASLFYLKGWARVVCFFLLCLGAMLSLQKAALANIVIVLFFAYWLKLIKRHTCFSPSFLQGWVYLYFPCRLRGWQSGNRASTDCRAPHLRFLSLARCSILRIHIRSGNCTAFGNIVFLR